MALNADNQQITPPNSNGRLRVFDALRGFSMLSVVYMHVLLGAGIGSYSTVSGSIVMGWFMPLFFFISGFFSYKPLHKWNRATIGIQLSQKVKALLISTIIFYGLLSYVHGGNILGWLNNGFRWYWFTPVLFQMYLLYIIAVCISFVAKRDASLFLMIIITVLLWFVKDNIYLNSTPWWPVINGAAICYYIQWFVTGLIVRRYHGKILKWLDLDAVKAILILGYVVLLCITLAKNDSMHPVIQNIASLAISYFGVFLLYMLFYQARKFFDGDSRVARGLCFTGQRTLDIYMIHYFFVPAFPVIGAWLEPNSMVLFQLLYGLSTAVIITTISLIISWAIRTCPILADWCLGVRGR